MQVLDEPLRTLLPADGGLVADNARQPQIAGQLDTGPAQSRRRMYHGNESTLHVLGTPAKDPVSVAPWGVTGTDGNGVRVPVEDQTGPIPATGNAAVDVRPPGQEHVLLDGEPLALQQLRQER